MLKVYNEQCKVNLRGREKEKENEQQLNSSYDVNWTERAHAHKKVIPQNQNVQNLKALALGIKAIAGVNKP